MTTPTQPTAQQIQQAQQDGVHVADGVRVSTLQLQTKMENAKLTALSRDRSRLALKYGATSPQVASIDQRTARQTAVISVLQGDLTRATTPAPSPGTGGGVVHGHVHHHQRTGGPPVTVHACHRDKGEIGHATVDERGYFKLELRGDQHPGAAGYLASFRLEVREGDKVVHGDREELEVRLGEAVYREIRTRAAQRKG